MVVYVMTAAPWLQNFRDKGFAYPLPAFSEDEAATMVENFRRLDDEMQKVAQECLFGPCCRAVLTEAAPTSCEATDIGSRSTFSPHGSTTLCGIRRSCSM